MTAHCLTAPPRDVSQQCRLSGRTAPRRFGSRASTSTSAGTSPWRRARWCTRTGTTLLLLLLLLLLLCLVVLVLVLVLTSAAALAAVRLALHACGRRQRVGYSISASPCNSSASLCLSSASRMPRCYRLRHTTGRLRPGAAATVVALMALMVLLVLVELAAAVVAASLMSAAQPRCGRGSGGWSVSTSVATVTAPRWLHWSISCGPRNLTTSPWTMVRRIRWTMTSHLNPPTTTTTAAQRRWPT
jgi:hypothetical protein